MHLTFIHDTHSESDSYQVIADAVPRVGDKVLIPTQLQRRFVVVSVAHAFSSDDAQTILVELDDDPSPEGQRLWRGATP